MTRNVYYTATTLDGFLADEHDSLAWLFKQEQDDDGPMSYRAFIRDIGTIVMGATTYEWIRAHMATTGEKWAYDVPSWVFTHRDLATVKGADLRFVGGDVETTYGEIAAAAGDRDVWVVGGGDLAAHFAEAGHLDEIVVSIAPVTLGAGRPLFPRRWDLRLVDLAQNGAFACARYEVVGPLTA
jgi:dihydrofolate reductase